jgi:hypothetical protein
MNPLHISHYFNSNFYIPVVKLTNSFLGRLIAEVSGSHAHIHTHTHTHTHPTHIPTHTHTHTHTNTPTQTHTQTPTHTHTHTHPHTHTQIHTHTNPHTHTHTHTHSVGLYLTNDQLAPEATNFIAHKQTQEKNIHALSGIRTCDRSNRASADVRLDRTATEMSKFNITSLLLRLGFPINLFCHIVKLT